MRFMIRNLIKGTIGLVFRTFVATFIVAFIIRGMMVVMGTADSHPFWNVYANVLVVTIFIIYPIQGLFWLFGSD